MIIVNFKIVFGTAGASWLQSVAGVFDGKAAATFVVLAGVGLALMTKGAVQNDDQTKLQRARVRIAKRALFLFAVGLSYIFIWPADILHFYGVYMLITLLLLTRKRALIVLVAVLLILVYPVLMGYWDYEMGWNFDDYSYEGFWTLDGFVRNLFYNGFHPVLPWAAFMLIGYWFGQKDLHDRAFVKKAFWWSTVVFVLIQAFSAWAIFALGPSFPEVEYVFGVSPMPPLPLYMFNGIAIAISIISACILICQGREKNRLIDALYKTGQLALTFYVAHVVIGMGAVEVFSPGSYGLHSIEFSVIYALVFSGACILFAVLWRKYREAGPLEWVMRKLTD